MAKKSNFQNSSKSRSIKSNIKKYILPLAIVGGGVIGYYAFNRITDNDSHKSIKALPIKTKAIPATKLNLKTVSGQDIVDNLVLKYSKGIKKDTVFAIYNHPNTCCPGNVQPYVLDTLTFNPHYVNLANRKSTHNSLKLKASYLGALKQITGLEKTVDSLKNVIKKTGIASGHSSSVDGCCGSVYGLRNAKVNKK